MRSGTVVLLASLALVVAGLGPSPAQAPEDEEQRPTVLRAVPVPPSLPEAAPGAFLPGGSDYRIGRQDLLEIRVFGLDELNQTVRVSDDGSITLPLLGRLEIAGLTKGGLEQQIASLLGERYVRDPQVTVFVVEYESRKISVTGAVKKPGTFEMLGSKTLLEMISLAGGLDENFGDDIIVFRTDPEGQTHQVRVDTDMLVYAADPRYNIRLEPNDIVYVPVIETVRIFVSGAVKNPNLYEVPANEPVTVLRAITLAGGTTDRAAEKRIQIMRTDADGTRQTYAVNLKHIRRGKEQDPILQKDDMVFVPEAFF